MRDLSACAEECFKCIRSYKRKHSLIQGQSFDIKCGGIPSEYVPLEILEDLPEGEREIAQAMVDPVAWAAKALDWHCLDPDGEIWKRKNPDEYYAWLQKNPNKDIEGHSRYHRPYQASMLQCQATRKVFRIGRQCLASSAKVHLKDGTTRSIKDIKVGDQILSLKEEVNTQTYSKVIDHWSSGIKKIYRIKTNFGREIECSDNHPFLILNNKNSSKEWKSINEGLSIGNRIAVSTEDMENLSIEDPHIVEDILWDYVSSIEELREEETWDIEVEGTHNFVANGIYTHNSGKSEALVISMLYSMFTKPGIPKNEGFEIILITPYQSQIDLIFTRMMQLIRSSSITQNSLKRSVKAPMYSIQLHNDSKVTGFTAGTKSGGNADAVRGQHGHMLVFDEADYLSSSDIDSALSIITNYPDATVWMSSTPSGRRERFFQTCGSKIFKEYHYPSQVNPMWNEDLEILFREQLTEIGYKHEILAQFGEQEQGVFQNSYIQAAKADYSYGDMARDSSWTYTIGVDWNDVKNGTTISVLGFNPLKTLFYVVDRYVVSREGWTQLTACNKIAELNRIWRPIVIYIDSGFGGCVGPETIIQTIDGAKYIKDIEKDDLVLGSDGEFYPVEDKVLSETKESFSLKPHKCPEIIISKEHPFLTLRTKRKFKDTNFLEKDFKWRSCEEIDIKTDLIAIAKTKSLFVDPIIDLLDLLPSYNLDYSEKYIWSKNSNRNKNNEKSIAKLAKYSSCGTATINRLKRNIKNNKKLTPRQARIKEQLDLKFKKDWTVSPKIEFSRYLDIEDERLQLIFGWYLSEGSIGTNGHSIEITQKKDLHMVEFLKMTEMAKEIFPSVSLLNKTDGTKRLLIYGKIAVKIFEYFCGKYAHQKRIHQTLMNVKNNKLIKGIILGDGCSRMNSSTSHSVSLSMTSFHLVSQIRQLFINQGILPSMYTVPSRNGNRKQLRIDLGGNEEVTDKISKILDIKIDNPSRRNRRNWIDTPNYILTGIRSLKKIEDQSNLIDLSVSGINSFTGNGIILHNTQWEVLRKYGYDSLADPAKGPTHPDSKLRDIVKKYDFGSKVDVHDLFTKRVISKPAKPFLVENSVRRFESNDIRFPKDDEKLEAQLQGYIIDRITMSGMPVYKAGDASAGDHSLDALMLSILGFTLEATPLGKPKYDTGIAFSGGFGEATDPLIHKGDTVVHPGNRKEKNKEKREHKRPASERDAVVNKNKNLLSGPNDLPASNTNQGKNNVGLWTWPGFGHDAPKPRVRTLAEAEGEAGKRIGLKRRSSGKPSRKNI